MTRKQCHSAAWGKRFLMLSAVILSAGFAFAGSPKMSKDLEGRNTSDLVDVIVQFRQTPTQTHFSKLQARGGLLKRQLGLVKGGSFRLPASALKDLANDPDVAYVSLDRPLYTTGAASLTAVLDYHDETVNAPQAWA